ncbi:hypothetical protein AYI68_g5219 [Smittium mucronatum]|uniref:Gfd2/YDR514C-like C-terminal domain-containing protein n=1 Tax=Smittium mucronatum TaxID=133383 RepID=A0A1R0GUW3_9FUNG|nr:hypothetical protein AYI68_g5219 [Smittium mucronatum]
MFGSSSESEAPSKASKDQKTTNPDHSLSFRSYEMNDLPVSSKKSTNGGLKSQTQSSSTNSDFKTWASPNQVKNIVSIPSEWPPSKSSLNPLENDTEWPNMRTDVYLNDKGKLDGPGKVESKIPLLLGAMSSKRAKKISLGSQLSHSEAKRSEYKKLNPVNEGDLENWVFVNDAEKLWLRCCFKLENKKIVRTMLRSNDFFLNSDRQFAIASREGEKKLDIAVDWMSLELIRQQIELETQEKLPKIPHKKMGSVDIHRVSDEEDLLQLRSIVKKHNNKLLKLESNNSKLRQIYSQWLKLKTLMEKKSHSVISIDCEMWEQNHNYLTELGWTMYNTKDDLYLSRHYIIAEHYYLENKLHVGDNRDNFLFGRTVVSPLKIALEKFVSDVKSIEPVIIVGHDMAADLKILKKHGIDFSINTPNNETSPVSGNGSNDSKLPPVSKFSLVDTSMLYMGLVSNINEKPSLSNVLKHYGTQIIFPHNAGNDAAYTMLAFLKLYRDDIPTVLGKPATHLLYDISDVSLTTGLLGAEPKSSSLPSFANTDDTINSDEEQHKLKDKNSKRAAALNTERAYESLFFSDKSALRDLPVYKRKSLQLEPNNN